MAVSRSPREFLERVGLLRATIPPNSRLAVGDLLIHKIPLASPPGPLQEILIKYEGEPPPDRGITHPWADQ